MKAFQKYVFRQILGPLLAILGALTAIAILTQSLNQMDILVDQRSSAGAFLWITLLSMPQILSLILPLAIFFAVAYTINRLQTDSELVVAIGAGFSPWQLIAPVFRLATLAALIHLVSNVIIQPASYREMRETIYSVRSNLAASLIRDGSFTSPAEGLTLYARSTDARGLMHDVFIHDERNPKKPVTYTARRGATAVVEGRPALIMREGQISQPKDDGSVDLLDFKQYVIELGEFPAEPTSVLLKPSDRFLSELFAPNLANHYDQRNVDRFLAEGHGRLATPLLNIALAMIALVTLVTGDFNRRGYGARLARGAVLALLVRLVALGIQSGARETYWLNYVQYGLPIAVIIVCIWVMVTARRGARRKAPPEEVEHRHAELATA
jgi:lipopolysaccharide export system permease protein